MNGQWAMGNWQSARSARVGLCAVLLLALAPPLCAGESVELKSAREAITKGKYADGLKVLDKLLGEKKTPDVVSAARTLRVRALGDTGRYKEAVAEAAKVEQLAPKSADSLALHAEALMAVGRYPEAGERLARATKLDAKHVKSRTLARQLAKTMGDKNALGRETTFFFRLYSQGKAKTAEALTAVAMAAEDDDPHGAWREYNSAHKANPKYLDAYLHAGFHCLSKYAWKYAAEEFKKALKLNPHAAAAHAGLAIVALRNGKFKPAEAAIATALKINPSLPVARALRAALLTMEERHAEARQQLEAVLAVNPHHLDALSLLAAHHEALGKTAERDKVARRVLALNPRHADLYTTLARAGERRRQFPLAVQWARKAIALDGEYWEGYYLAGMNLLRIGEEREGYRLLDRAFKLNSFNIWAYNMLNVLDRDFKQKRFDRLETAHFVVKLPTGQSRVLWPYVKSILEEAWEKFTRKYGVEPVGPKEYGGKVLVLFFPDHEQFAVRTVGLPGLGALGACFGQVITLPSPRLARLRRSPHLLLAALYVERKQSQKAIAVLREHTSIHNNSLKAFILLGDLLAKEGKHSEAAAAFLGAIYIDPFATGPHLSAARAFEAIGAFGRAATEYTVVTHLDKRHLQALVGRARCLAEAGKADEARKAIAAVREIDPANAEIIKIEKKLKK